MSDTFHTVELIPVERIRANDYNPNAMAATTYEQLVASIKGRGFRSAIYVLPADQDGIHTIVDGEHRWRAAKESGLLHVPCVVLPANQDEAMMDTIAMNQLRGSLVPVRVALVIAELSKRIPVDVLEKELGFEDRELEDQLELLKLPDDIGKTIELQAEMEEREALQVVREEGLTSVAVDVGGVGAGVYDNLQAASGELGLQVIGVNFGARANDETLYVDKAAEIWWQLREALRLGTFQTLPGDEQIAQMTSRKCALDRKGRIQLEKKDELRRRGLPSPDQVDSLVLAREAQRQHDSLDLIVLTAEQQAEEDQAVWKVL